MNLNEIKKRAKRRHALLQKQKKDPRYQAVLGRLVKERFLIVPKVRPNRLHPTVEDALWAGTIEPRVLELLPAILLRRPKIFLQPKELPKDLEVAIKELKRGKAHTPFRNVPPEKYAAWEAVVKKRGPKKNAITKIYRFREEDLALLKVLQEKWRVNEVDAIRRALRNSA